MHQPNLEFAPDPATVGLALAWLDLGVDERPGQPDDVVDNLCIVESQAPRRTGDVDYRGRPAHGCYIALHDGPPTLV